MRRACLRGVWLLLLAGCAGGPPPPDWQIDATAALDAYQRHQLDGRTRLATQELGRARAAVARTGRPGLRARIDLVECALQVASLEFSPCAGFAARAGDATDQDRAYAAFLEGRWDGLEAAKLPAQYRPVFALRDAALAQVGDPLSRLIAAGVLMRRGEISPQAMQAAAESASAQGWRRPLLAWLGALRMRAERAGDTAGAAVWRRRMELVGEGMGR